MTVTVEILREVILQHVPVMSAEIVDYIDPSPGDTIVDATIGCGGHARPILERVRPTGRVIGIDQDKDALECAKENLKEFSDSLFLVNENFRNLDQILKTLEIEKIDGIVFDLGISSLQIDTPDRGFSIKHSAPLDMRMNRAGRVSAFELVNNLPLEEISRILKEYGEERFHAAIARAIIERRRRSQITTTGELAEIVVGAQRGHKFYKIHPATRTFQAFRIAVNDEIESFRQALTACAKYLAPGARVCVLSYHSIEDRVAKQVLRDFEREDTLKRLTKKPSRPSQTELSQNPRSRSAKLRVAEKGLKEGSQTA